MKYIDLTIVIPCYNVSEYVTKCLVSVAELSRFDINFEIIVINDGSTDSTKERIYEFINNNKFLNISYFETENSGLSKSRNLGIDKACGKYIWFVDADDFIIANNIVKVLAVGLRDDLDIVWFDHDLYDESYNKILKHKDDIKDFKHESILSGELFLDEIFNFSCMACMFLFRLDYIKRESFRFYPGIYFEDIFFVPIALDKCKKVRLVKIVCYNYLIRMNSIMRDSNKSIKRINDALFVALELYKYSKRANNSNYFIRFCNLLFIYNLRRSSKISYSYFVNIYSVLKKNKVLPLKFKGDIKILFNIALINTLGDKFYYVSKKMN